MQWYHLVVKTLMNNLIEAIILIGLHKGEDVLFPRIPFIPTDMAFEFKRLQFPIRLTFAMTINKAQGQSLFECRKQMVLSWGIICHMLQIR